MPVYNHQLPGPILDIVPIFRVQTPAFEQFLHPTLEFLLVFQNIAPLSYASAISAISTIPAATTPQANVSDSRHLLISHFMLSPPFLPLAFSLFGLAFRVVAYSAVLTSSICSCQCAKFLYPRLTLFFSLSCVQESLATNLQRLICCFKPHSDDDFLYFILAKAFLMLHTGCNIP